jgi:hypothetical protein
LQTLLWERKNPEVVTYTVTLSSDSRKLRLPQ